MKQASTRLYFARISCALGTVLLCRAMDSGHMTTCVAESGDMIGEDGAVLLILLQHGFVQNQLLRIELRKNMFGHRFAFLVLLQLNHGMGLPCKAHNLVAFPFIRMYATNSLRKSSISIRGSWIPCKKQGTFSPAACATSTQQHDFRWPFAGDRFSLHKLDANLIPLGISSTESQQLSWGNGAF